MKFNKTRIIPGFYKRPRLGTMWRLSNDAKKGYNFSYDGLNRLTAADYGTYNGSWVTTSAYDLGSVTYDNNGNITTLKWQL